MELPAWIKRIAYLTILMVTAFAGGYKAVGQAQELELGKGALFEARYDEAINYLRQASELYQAQENQAAFADCELLICQSYLGMGEFERGIETAQSILQLLDDDTAAMPMIRASALGLYGEGQLNLGRNDLALEYLHRAEDLFGSEPGEGHAECLEDLGITYLNNGNSELALQYHEQALDMRLKLFGPEALVVGDSYNNLGLVDVEDNPYLASGNFQKALEIYEKELGATHPKVAFCLNNMARAESNLGNFLDALRHLGRAQDIWDQQYPGDHPNKAFTLSNEGRVYEEMGSLDEAMGRQQQALEMYISVYGPKHPDVANTHFIIASLEGTAGNWKNAVDRYQRAIYANLYNQDFQTVDELPALRDYYNADVLLTSLWYKAQALENLHLSKSLKPKHLMQALSTVSKCDTLITQIRQLRLNESDKLRLAQFSKEIYEKGISLSLDLAAQPFARKRYYQQAFAFSERSKSAVLLEAIADTQAKNFADIPHELLQEEDSLKDEISYLRQKLASQTGGEEEQAWKDHLFEAQSSYRAFISTLEASYPRYFNLKYETQTATIDDIRRALPTDKAVLSYFEGDSSLYLFLLGPKRLEVIRKPKPSEYLKQIVGLRNTIKFRLDAPFWKVSQELYGELIPEFPRNVRKLLIVPDGALATIPFEVLSNPESEDQRFLMEDYAISYDYSLTLHLSRLEEASSVSNSDVLLVAPVSFEADRKLSALTASATEIEELKYLFQGQGWNVEEQTQDIATEASLKGADLSQFKYMHLATHGIVHESEPELSCIFLRRGSEDDGSLYAGELYNLKIAADLVTLSACETGLGKIAKGEGIVGLSRALLYAGAKNLIVSLWQVADQSTADLMISFYRVHLTHENADDISAALREAKLSMLRSSDFDHPYYWAPFILVGR